MVCVAPVAIGEPDLLAAGSAQLVQEAVHAFRDQGRVIDRQGPARCEEPIASTVVPALFHSMGEIMDCCGCGLPMQMLEQHEHAPTPGARPQTVRPVKDQWTYSGAQRPTWGVGPRGPTQPASPRQRRVRHACAPDVPRHTAGPRPRSASAKAHDAGLGTGGLRQYIATRCTEGGTLPGTSGRSCRAAAKSGPTPAGAAGQGRALSLPHVVGRGDGTTLPTGAMRRVPPGIWTRASRRTGRAQRRPCRPLCPFGGPERGLAAQREAGAVQPRRGIMPLHCPVRRPLRRQVYRCDRVCASHHVGQRRG